MSGRILVVDDVATNRMILRAKLAASYYDVLLSENGHDAIEKTRTEQPDLILLDVVMPDMNGYDVCKVLKSDPATQHIPVIMVTALNEASDRLRGLECGADDFLSKPINDLALFSRVRNLIRSKFMFDELRLRDRTTQELGLGNLLEGNSGILSAPGRITLVPPDEQTGASWSSLLAAQEGMNWKTLLAEASPAVFGEQTQSDVFMIHSDLGTKGEGLRLVSQLRSRPQSRHISILLVVPEGEQTTAAKGLDLGANDYIFDPFDPSELVVRLHSQVRRSQISERLRSNVVDTLRLAVLDPLTGLYNRRYAVQHVEKIRDRSKETGKQFALMLLDIDNFKHVNDRFGHGAGDEVLKEFSQRIQANLRGIDLVSRIGGEEFLVAMPDTTEPQARIASERLRRVIEESLFDIDGGKTKLPVTVSVGVTLGDPDAPNTEELIAQADKALYRSKSDGRNIVTLFNSAA